MGEQRKSDMRPDATPDPWTPLESATTQQLWNEIKRRCKDAMIVIVTQRGNIQYEGTSKYSTVGLHDWLGEQIEAGNLSSGSE